MNKLFEEELNKAYLKYHTNPISPNSLDPRIWYFLPDGGDPKLQPQVRTQILRDIEIINSAEQEGIKKRVWDYVIVGPVLEQDSSPKCSINVIVQLSTNNLDDLLKQKILYTIKDLNGRLAAGSLHPIFYIPTIRKINHEEYVAIYHPFQDSWIKKPLFLGEGKIDTKELSKDPAHKKNRKYSLNKGIKKLTTV